MPPVLNPFLRAFFRSTLPSQCSPVHHHILLVPTTEVLLTSRDRDSNASYADLSGSEEFLASHVLRVPGGVGPNNHVKDGTNFRENRGKAKQYSTANGRTVIIKDAFAYSNKGFKTLNQAQLLNDIIYYPDTFDAQPWLVYFISRPLIGTYEATPIIPARIIPTNSFAYLSEEEVNKAYVELRENQAAARSFPVDIPVEEKRNILRAAQEAQSPAPSASNTPATNGASAVMPRKKEVKSFGELLNLYPMIARQMQPGLERLFKEFAKELEKPLPVAPSQSSASRTSRRRSSVSSSESVALSLRSSISQGPNGYISNLEIDREEDIMRTSLETAVTAAIDLFQMVDKQQLSLLGATTDLTGSVVERMIERYIAEQVHHTILFPRLCSIRRPDDADLEGRMRQMADVDISQVGIDIGDSRKGKQELAIRLAKAVDIFKKMGVAGSPQEMMDILLAVQKHITMPEASAAKSGASYSEKQDHVLTINADTLVSLLLIVVIRSPVRHLLARLSYMRHFIFIDDVESGEMGYALSTFEAVLSYLARDASGLRKSSRRNRRLWHATRTGDIATIQGILEPDRPEYEPSTDSDDVEIEVPKSLPVRFAADQFSSDGATTNGDLENERPDRRSRRSLLWHHRGEDGPLAHIFPFQRAPTPPPLDLPKAKKKVTMEVRSQSSSSLYSFRSRTDSHDSGCGFEGDTSIEKLSKTQSPTGDSVLMMAVGAKQDKALDYLLSLSEYYSPDFILGDCNNEGTTLLSAAVQLGHSKTTEVLLTYLFDNCPNDEAIQMYIARQDSKGRCMAHYLFNQPQLINRIGHLVPWRLKDRNGQTPLFALCRSYDHEQYRNMVEKALFAATQAQDDGQPLHLDEHVDNKGNTLLHIVNDPHIAVKLLYRCDSDVNAPNDRHFTPLMVASKYGRTELVRVLFQDARVDLSAKDVRGLTAVELAKDDEVRNRIDDLVLLSNERGPDGRTTAVVRSFFVEDGTVRLVVKSGAPNGHSSITVTTCRRSVQDFENLAKWLAQEHPASWLPSINNLSSPFLIPSRPSRSILRDIQLRLDAFLKTLLMHPTFSTHEMVWEFFLVPDIEPSMLAERSARKAESRAERIRDEYTPMYDVREVELFIQHAKESVRSIHHATRSVIRRTNKLRNTTSDLVDAARLQNTAVKSLEFLPQNHLQALDKYTQSLMQSENSPLASFFYNLSATSSTISAILSSLNRPSTLISSMASHQQIVDKHNLSIRRSDRWPLGLLDEARARVQRNAQEMMENEKRKLDNLARELRYSQSVVAGELASWQEGRAGVGRKVLRGLVGRMVVVERARLEGMRRALRALRGGRTGGEVGVGGREVGGAGDDVVNPATDNVDEEMIVSGKGKVNGVVDGMEEEGLLDEDPSPIL